MTDKFGRILEFIYSAASGFEFALTVIALQEGDASRVFFRFLASMLFLGFVWVLVNDR
jgi:hypothetical protein